MTISRGDCSVWSQGVPSTIRCIETTCAGTAAGTSRSVREHPAPSGALRREAEVVLQLLRGEVREHPAPSGALRRGGDTPCDVVDLAVREHPAPSGALRHLLLAFERGVAVLGQGAPSTIRCIKTSSYEFPARDSNTCQGAPSTIRCIKTSGRAVLDCCCPQGQGAPSTIRCIKTRSLSNRSRFFLLVVREHPAPSGALRLLHGPPVVRPHLVSGSTQHHQVH